MTVCSDGEETAAVSFGIDLGGTKILAGAASDADEVVVAMELATDASSFGAVVDQLCSVVEALAEGRPVRRLVVGVPGAVDPLSGAISLCPNVPLESVRPVSQILSERFGGCQVSVENDVNVAAVGEACWDVETPCSSLAFLSFGTGIGLGIIHGGEIWKGHRGRAGEISLLPLGAASSASDGVGRAAVLEDRVGSPAIRDRFGEADLTVRDIFGRAAQGDARAAGLIDEVAREAAFGVSAIQSLIDPAVIVLGGSIGVQPVFAEAVKRHVAVSFPYETEIRTARLGARAGMLGAVCMATRAGGNSEV